MGRLLHPLYPFWKLRDHYSDSGRLTDEQKLNYWQMLKAKLPGWLASHESLQARLRTFLSFQ